MGSRRTLPLTLVAMVLSALVCATPAAADPADEARAVATRFFGALAVGDAQTVCALFSPAALQRIGGDAKCKVAFTDDSGPDDEAVETLLRAYVAAKRSADRRHAGYVTKRFGPRALAREMERLDPELDVKLGNRPKAAAGQLATTAVLDTRSTARRVVFYAESDDGSILRLSAPRKGRPLLAEVAQGVAETGPPAPPEPAFAFTVDSVSFAAGTAYVRGSLRPREADEEEPVVFPVLLVLVPGGDGRYLVDDLFVSAFPVLGP